MKIYKFFLLFYFFVGSNHILSQELEYDQAFLESLPDDVRIELLNQSKEKNESEETQYRRPSSFIDKPDSELEIDRFGVSFFSMMQTTLMPINEPNFDASYILDFGDQLQLQLLGQKSSILKLNINRDGSVSIPDIGKLYLSGLSLGDAIDLIKQSVDASYIGVEAYVTLTNVRDIQIIVSGNVFNPGPYTLNGNSNVFHALNISGGPSELGSFRSINLIRDGKVIEEIDLYKTFIFGEPSFGTRLRSGDMIFVNPAQSLVSIYGGVNRIGTYEVNENESLSDLLYFANGFTAIADKKNIKIEQIKDGKVIISDINEPLETVYLSNGEVVYVREFPIRTVEVTGAVNNPGRYKINEGDGVYEVILRAGGYSSNAYEFGGVLLNEQALEASLLAQDELHRSFLSSLAKNPSMAIESNASVLSILDELRESEPSGRVNAEFNLLEIKNNPSLNKTLQDGDVIIIPEKIDHIYIFGEVSNQGTIQFVDGEDVNFYITNKGGLTDSADVNNIFILHPNGISEKIKRKNVFRDGNSEIKLFPGSIVFIPRKSNSAYTAQSLQAYVNIIGNLGVSLASLAVIKD